MFSQALIWPSKQIERHIPFLSMEPPAFVVHGAQYCGKWLTA
jgi:hypothetical protein